ncbi:beta-ketoacyl-[acyl-carrier-protein] synthase family protein [Actinacidiphila sp. ITFR-21]|uniref:beta-ketoacyl-[acyl-carrier-protein] synthase family protein n=1 Tax=Actinacidiphila sp. ITFR-21 TaxID=3075199 RepID=UPI002889F92C|nr:beta-ketoacyl-[acyl-carrier-protein] synthase family protein [Streptomyces sp. ITFR-21]WNI18964.1 beta-ketoacyl-[acyl-carrier-protein] synthase family protein [Streptomyces sp. ITFR-21]
MNRRVVITGIGPVSEIGVGVHAFGEGLRAGRSGVGPITSFDTTGFERVVAGEVRDFRPQDILRRLSPADWGRSSLFAAAAARLAVEDAGIDPPPTRTAAVVGTTTGELLPLVDITASWHENGIGVPDREAAAKLPTSRLGLAVAEELGLRGEAVTLGTACAAGNYAIGHAYDLITLGEADVAVAGGADSVNRFLHAGFHRLGALTAERCSPFDRDRSGILTAEGGVALVLETLDSARDRGARIYAEILGWAMTCDARHPVAPDADSIARCVRLAHKRAGVSPDQVDYICAHGTGTRTNDLVESTAIRSVFGEQPPPMSSIKSMLGHTMGAASGFGAAACALSIHDGFLPPTVNHVTHDPQLAGVDPVPNRSRSTEVRVAQNNGFAFGGNNAIVMLGSAQ